MGFKFTVDTNIQRGLDIGKNPLHGGYNLSQYRVKYPSFGSLPFKDFRTPQYTLSSYRDNPFWNLKAPENDIVDALYSQAAQFNPYQGFYDVNNNSDVQNIMGYNNLSGGNIYADGTFAGIDPNALAKSKEISQGITNKAKSVVKTPKTSTGSSINWGNVGKTAAGIASLIPESEMTIGGTTFKRGLWDAADPVYRQQVRRYRTWSGIRNRSCYRGFHIPHATRQSSS